MDNEFFQIDHLNKMYANFYREKGIKPTQLIVGEKEYDDIQNWYYEYYNPNSKESIDETALRHRKFIEELHTKPFGLELIKVDRESYLELK